MGKLIEKQLNKSITKFYVNNDLVLNSSSKMRRCFRSYLKTL